MIYEITETIPFNFDEIYSDITGKLAAKGYDAIYEGSNIAQVVTAMTYLVSMLNANTAANINEMLLPLAQKRNNVLNDARLLGYEIKHTISYRYELTLTLEAGNHIIKKYTEFVDGGLKYYYMGNDIEMIDVPEGTKQKIIVIEGTLKKYSEESTLKHTIVNYLTEFGTEEPEHFIDVPFTNVEDSTMEVFLTYYDMYGIFHEKEQWSRCANLFIERDQILPLQYVRMDNIEMKTPRLYFKIGEMGNTLRLGTIVEMNVLQSSGSLGEMVAIPKTTSTTFTGTIDNFELIVQGSDEESIESVRANAPLFYNSASRAVTRSDYLSITKRENSVKKAMIWGGEDEDPVEPGHIFFSLTPSTSIRSFSNDIENKLYTLNNRFDGINNFLEPEDFISTDYTSNNEVLNPGVFDVISKLAVPSMKFNIRNPIYFDFDYTITIKKYNITNTKKEIHQLVFDVINEYFIDGGEISAEEFEFEYFQSNLVKRIDPIFTDKSGFDISMKLSIPLFEQQIIWDANNLNSGKFVINFANPFESLYENNAGNLIVDALPDIRGSFLSHNITYDISSLIGNEIMDKYVTFPIKWNSKTIGIYKIYNNYKKYIVIELFVDKTNSNTVLDYSLFVPSLHDPVSLGLKYLSSNMKFYKNTIPRLTSVSFV